MKIYRVVKEKSTGDIVAIHSISGPGTDGRTNDEVIALTGLDPKLHIVEERTAITVEMQTHINAKIAQDIQAEQKIETDKNNLRAKIKAALSLTDAEANILLP